MMMTYPAFWVSSTPPNIWYRFLPIKYHNLTAIQHQRDQAVYDLNPWTIIARAITVLWLAREMVVAMNTFQERKTCTI